MVDLEKIFEEVDNLDTDRIMDLMRILINIDTVVPPGKSYREYVDAILPYFKDLNYSLEEVLVPKELVQEIPLELIGPRVNLVAKKDFGQNKWVNFYGHMDVVPAPNNGVEKWQFPPFEAKILENGDLYGRGVADMKGSMVCLILALQIIESLNLTPLFNILVMNCTDEEIGVWPGVKYLAEKGYIEGTVYCMEGRINPIILSGAAGNLDVTVETIGISCHSGMNYLGVNALEEMVPILVELMELKKIVEKRESRDISGGPNNKEGKKRNLTPMFNLDIIRSGEKSNIVPDICQLVINRRIIPDEKYLEAKQEIVDAIERGKKKSKAIEVKITFNYSYPPLKIDTNGPGIRRMKKVISLVQEVPEDQIRTMGMAGSLDMSFIAQILNTQDIIIHGVGNKDSHIHGVNEMIRLKDVKTYIKEILVFLLIEF
ncbi:hypothetical protein LCGC14_0632460 [marine sediment metagenome]|uniref:Peptidase M20 dimerisation domain-containing protein n=1 Tax=marine sediment metagenome TaxID=412755 RepID=A0A0F9UA39_9ZZZZ|nr:MAG: putative succinyl-diaminopimelate desuccinylase [Candidatus Lokiarchaeum sp. GC14_75]